MARSSNSSTAMHTQGLPLETDDAGFAEDLFQGFDVEEDSMRFLADVFLSETTPPQEKASLLQTSLTSGCEDWYLRLHHAAARKTQEDAPKDPLDAADLLAFLPPHGVFSAPSLPKPEPAWAETDRLILQVVESFRQRPFTPAAQVGSKARREQPAVQNTALPPRRPAVSKVCKSHFWAPPDEAGNACHKSSRCTVLRRAGDNRANLTAGIVPSPIDISPVQRRVDEHGPSPKKAKLSHTSEGQLTTAHRSVSTEIHDILVQPIVPPSWAVVQTKSRSPAKSPFFAPPMPEPSPRKNKRPPAGTVSAIPFPPLDAPCFSLIQEKLSHEPFWLLIAVTFLIKTSGKLAIPAFYAVKERFPTPQHLADPESEPDLMDMIRHLGLVVNRTAAVQKYARGWIDTPPTPGVRFRVKGYDQRTDTGEEEAEEFHVNRRDVQAVNEPDDAWEIGHLTQGKYALDSWRIFCRDELLDRAQDWNGKGASPDFQPEWMRVCPHDKELRACLRWMWMKEGWEWDPATGEKSALRPDMAAAVNEGRVEYDDTGGLRIVEAAS